MRKTGHINRQSSCTLVAAHSRTMVVGETDHRFKLTGMAQHQAVDHTANTQIPITGYATLRLAK